MPSIQYGKSLCSKCEKEVKNSELFHIIVNKGIPDTYISWNDDPNFHSWTADITYYKENVDSMLLLCEECKNKLLNWICCKD